MNIKMVTRFTLSTKISVKLLMAFGVNGQAVQEVQYVDTEQKQDNGLVRMVRPELMLTVWELIWKRPPIVTIHAVRYIKFENSVALTNAIIYVQLHMISILETFLVFKMLIRASFSKDHFSVGISLLGPMIPNCCIKRMVWSVAMPLSCTTIQLIKNGILLQILGQQRICHQWVNSTKMFKV